MKTRFTRWVLLLAIAMVAGADAATSGTVERMYVFNCGEIAIKDISHWSPGVNAGKPFEFSNHCYLIRHPKGLMLWGLGLRGRRRRAAQRRGRAHRSQRRPPAAHARVAARGDRADAGSHHASRVLPHAQRSRRQRAAVRQGHALHPGGRIRRRVLRHRLREVRFQSTHLRDSSAAIPSSIWGAITMCSATAR